MMRPRRSEPWSRARAAGSWNDSGIGDRRAACGTPRRIQEQPIFFPAEGETLSGVYSAPLEADSRAVIVLGVGGTTPTATGRNRFFVTLCRRLAELGQPTLRFDYHGLGDRTGRSEFRLDRPFLGDLEGAVSCVVDQGVTRYVLLGTCFGARTALSGAPMLKGPDGLVLLTPPVREYALSEPRTAGRALRDYATAVIRPKSLLGPDERLTVRRHLRFAGSGGRIALRRVRDRLSGKRGSLSWVSRRFLDPLTTLAERRTPVLTLYGTNDEEYRDFEVARGEGLGAFLARLPSVEVQTLDGQVHGFTRVVSRRPTMDAIVDWLDRVSPRKDPS